MASFTEADLEDLTRCWKSGRSGARGSAGCCSAEKRRARMIAVEQDTSLTGLIRAHLQALVEREKVLKESSVAELHALHARSEAVVGKRNWSRDDLHGRG